MSLHSILHGPRTLFISIYIFNAAAIMFTLRIAHKSFVNIKFDEHVVQATALLPQLRGTAIYKLWTYNQCFFFYGRLKMFVFVYFDWQRKTLGTLIYFIIHSDRS